VADRPRVFVSRLIPDDGLGPIRESCEAHIWEGELPPGREELLMAVGELGFVVALVVRLDHLIAGVPRDPVYPERANVEVTAHEMEVARAQTLPVRGVRIVRVDVRRPNDVGKEHRTERRFAGVGHERKPRRSPSRSQPGKLPA